MDLQAAHRIITSSFERAYDESAFRSFVSNLLVQAEMKQSGHRSGQMIYESFREHVAQYKRIAKYTDPHGEVLDVLAVKLKTPHKLERARTMQRNFVATYLNDSVRPDREAALVAYYADGTDEWRLSLVRLEYRTVVGDDGKVKTEKEVTPVRYSFLVGKGEPSHTPEKQFESLVQQESTPTLAELQEAFDIEVVTDAFFESYRSHYLALKSDVAAAIADDDTARAEFEEKDITPEAFAKKLLGQLVFLYFLQKKGWLGVRRGEAWGEGPTGFLRQLYEGAYVAYENYYQDLLEPLFYDALATDRGSGNYFSPLNCRIPFLNGGLFQPINDFKRARVQLSLPNATFGRIFDTFDRYNFTVREDEPLDKEVAVDPEMLGKVFEKMLDADQRKKKGAFYTPRDIVHYMCQQSLIDHLDTALNVRDLSLRPPEPQQQDAFGGSSPQQGVLAGEDYNPEVERNHLEALLRDGINWIEHDTRVLNGDSSKGGKYDGTYRAPDSIREHAQTIDAILANVKVCDPAVGSGAFPVGMMQEIVQARRVLNTYLDDGVDRSAYALKRHAIQETIHGVDIEPSAIDIAQLRLWLSLVVDEEDFEHIKPLPNLRYKIVQGDALQRMERHVFNNEKEDRLHQLMNAYVNTAYPSEKERLQEQIDVLLDALLDEDEFDFQLYFGTVFKEKGGFDIVIGNPPYVRAGAQTTLQKEDFKRHFETYSGTADLYVYFIERGIQLLRKRGVFCYIVSNKWMRASYGKMLRSWLTKRDIVELIDFRDTPVFPGTAVYPCILRMHNGQSSNSFRASEIESLSYRKNSTLATKVAQDSYRVERKSLSDEGWALVNSDTQQLLDAISATGMRLLEYISGEIYYGVKTGLNKAFVITQGRRSEIIKADPESASLIHPFLSGKNVSRYEPASSNEYVIAVPSGWTDAHSGNDRDKWAWFEDQFPGVADHLSDYEEAARKRYDQGDYWWELRSCSYYEKFEATKILFPDLSRRGDFSIDDEGYYAANTIYMIPEAGKYLLGLLNSKLMTFYYANHFSVYRGGYLRFFTQYVERLPIRTINEDDADDVRRRDAIVERVDRMLDLHARRAEATTDAECAQLQEQIDKTDAEIDQLVYALYGLSEEDVAIVEGNLVD
jgi:hypothetical protein